MHRFIQIYPSEFIDSKTCIHGVKLRVVHVFSGRIQGYIIWTSREKRYIANPKKTALPVRLILPLYIIENQQTGLVVFLAQQTAPLKITTLHRGTQQHRQGVKKSQTPGMELGLVMLWDGWGRKAAIGWKLYGRTMWIIMSLYNIRIHISGQFFSK